MIACPTCSSTCTLSYSASPKQRQSRGLKNIGRVRSTRPSSTLGYSNEGVRPERGVMSRPLPWWVLHGRGYVFIRIGLFPHLVSGDCLAFLMCTLIARACPMSDDTGLY